MVLHMINKYDQLPNLDGPKCWRFKNGRYRKLQFLELLGDSADEDDGVPEATHGYVFKVDIDSQLFALKIVM
jgi:hypothetical protein